MEPANWVVIWLNSVTSKKDNAVHCQYLIHTLEHSSLLTRQILIIPLKLSRVQRVNTKYIHCNRPEFGWPADCLNQWHPLTQIWFVCRANRDWVRVNTTERMNKKIRGRMEQTKDLNEERQQAKKSASNGPGTVKSHRKSNPLITTTTYITSFDLSLTGHFLLSSRLWLLNLRKTIFGARS